MLPKCQGKRSSELTTCLLGAVVSTVNRRDAGYAELDVTVTSPLGRNLPIEVKGSPDGEVIEFTPAVSGKYRIAINYGGQAVPGSPVTFIANDSPNVPRVPQVRTKTNWCTHITRSIHYYYIFIIFLLY